MWRDNGGTTTKGLVETKRENGGTEEEERWHRRARVMAAKKKEIFEGVVNGEEMNEVGGRGGGRKMEAH